MKKLAKLFILLALSGCMSPVDRFSQLTPPIVLVGKSDKGSITVCDSNNIYVTIGHEFYLAKTISGSYQKGDTLIYFKLRTK
jgi:hypothetical protein